jgi:hypothetical protein
MIYMAPLLVLTLLVSLPQYILAYIIKAASDYTPKKWNPFLVGTVLLMIAFLASAFIMAYGARVFGLDVFRVRSTISVGFFLFCFVAILIYYNLSKRVPQSAQIKG